MRLSLTVVCRSCVKGRRGNLKDEPGLVFRGERNTPGFISTEQFPMCPNCGRSELVIQATMLPQ